jgi:adenylate cyclase
MAELQTTRRLAAVLAADVVGYSRLMGADEEGTLQALNAHIDLAFKPRTAEWNGRIFKTTGDGVLVEFSSVVNAVKCAVAIQADVAARNAAVPGDRRLEFRMGVTLGDVILQDGDIFGEGVNVAARLEGLARAGEICISRAARDQIRDKLDYGLEDWGEVKVKNIPRPVRVFRLLTSPEDLGKTVQRAPVRGSRRWLAPLAILAVLGIAGTGILLWQQSRSRVEAASLDRMAYPLPDSPSVAVLPFANLSNDPDQEYFADGITADIITDISKVSGLMIVAHTSTFTYKGKQVKVRQVAEDLGVRYVLTGSVQREGNKLRLTAQLIDALKGSYLWADRYDREVGDVFELQSEITKQVVKAMAVTLKASEHDRLFQKRVANIDAYDAFLRARTLVDEPSRDNIEKGEKLFERAIALDPNFAGGYAGLAFNYSVKARFHYGPSPEADAKKSLELAQAAIKTDGGFAWSYIALASAELANGHHDSALDAVKQALALQPNDYETNLFMGYYLNFAGQSDAAIGYLERANMLSRVDTIRGLGFLGMAYFSAGRFAECEAVELKRFEKFGAPGQAVGHVFLAAAQASLGEMDKAAATVGRFRRMMPGFRISSWAWLENYKLPESRERLYDAAIKAGIPE